MWRECGELQRGREGCTPLSIYGASGGGAHAASASDGAPSASCNVPRLKYASALDGERASCGTRGAGERAARGRQSGRHAHRSAVGAARFCVPAGSLQHHPVGVQPSRVGRAQPEPGIKGAHGRCEVSERLQHQAVLKPPIGKCRMEAGGAFVAARGGVEPALVLKRVAKAHQLVGTSVGSIWALAAARAQPAHVPTYGDRARRDGAQGYLVGRTELTSQNLGSMPAL